MPKRKKDWEGLYLRFALMAESQGHIPIRIPSKTARAQCAKCLCYLILKEEDLEDCGTMIYSPCDPNAVDKRGQFSYEPMSPQHAARVNAAWKPPAEK